MLLDPVAFAATLPAGTPPDAIRRGYQDALWALFHRQLDAVIQANGPDLELAALAGTALRVSITDEPDDDGQGDVPPTQFVGPRLVSSSGDPM